MSCEGELFPERVVPAILLGALRPNGALIVDASMPVMEPVVGEDARPWPLGGMPGPEGKPGGGCSVLGFDIIDYL